MTRGPYPKRGGSLSSYSIEETLSSGLGGGKEQLDLFHIFYWKEGINMKVEERKIKRRVKGNN